MLSHFVVASLLALVYVGDGIGSSDFLHVLEYKAHDVSTQTKILEQYEMFHTRHRRAAEINSSSTTQNITIKHVHHRYYSSKYLYNGESYWNELEGHQKSFKHMYLASGSLRVAKIRLKFKFPYYGHPVENITVTSGGFLYMGWVTTSFRIMRQVMYIAPLMAYFNPTINGSASIFFLNTESQFTVQWTNISLENDRAAGPFTFQCTLFKSGRIVLAYKSLPKKASEIPQSAQISVRIGLSDAFYGYKYAIYHGRLVLVRVFYIYDKVSFNKTWIQSGSAIDIMPITSCISATSCEACASRILNTQFNCTWCSRLHRCSDGIDRHYFEWYHNSCQKLAITKAYQCLATASPSLPTNTNTIERHKIVLATGDKSSIGAGTIVAVCLVLVFIIALGAWCFYAYTNPTSRSGLFLIGLRYKPREMFRRNGTDGGVSVANTTRSSTLA